MARQSKRQTETATAVLRTIRTVLVYALLITVAVITTGPFVMMISASFQTMTFLTFPIDFIPPQPTLGNYTSLFSQTMMGRWVLNSVWITVATTALQLVTCSMAAYAFARGDFPGRDVIFWLFMATLMVPGTVTIVPMFLLLSRIGWVNSFWGLIVPHATSIFGTFLLRQYYTTIPRDYDDAAVMDGATKWDTYLRVIMPLGKPPLVTLATLTFLSTWNAFLYPLIMTTTATMRPLTVGLATMVVQRGQAGLQMAGATVVFLPTFVFFLFMQRHVVRGIALSGVKG